MSASAGSSSRAWLGGVTSSAVGRIVAGKAASDLGSRGALLLVVALTIHYAGIDAYGAYSQLFVLTTLLGPFVVLGAAQSIVPHFAGRSWTAASQQRVLQLLFACVAAATLGSAVFALAAPEIADAVIDWPGAADLFRWGAPLVGLVGIETVLLYLLQARRRFAAHIVLQLIAAIASAVGVAVILPRSGDVLDVIRTLFAVRFVVAAVGLVVALRGPVEVGDDDVPAISFLFRFGIGVAIADAGAWAVQLADRLVYGRYGDAASLGAYAAVYTATGLLAMVGGAVLYPAFPVLAAAWRADARAGISRAIQTPHHLLAFLCVPIAAYLILVTEPGLAVVGQGDVQPGIAVVILVVGSVTMTQWNGFAHYILLVVEGGRAVRPAWLIGAVVAVALAFALVPPFGLVGAALASFLTVALIEVMLAARASRWADLRSAYAWRTTVVAVLAASGAALPAVAILRAIDLSLPTLVVASAVFWSVYLVVMISAGELPYGSRRRA